MSFESQTDLLSLETTKISVNQEAKVKKMSRFYINTFYIYKKKVRRAAKKILSTNETIVNK